MDAATSGTGGMGGGGVGGSTAGAGGTSAGTGGTTAGAGGAPAMGSLAARLTVTSVTAPAGVKPGARNWRVWASVSLGVAPVYTAPLASCGTLVCYTTGNGAALTARVARLGPDDTLVATLDLGPFECRGLAAGPGGSFAALLFDDAANDIQVRRFDPAGTMLSSTRLVNADNQPTDFGIGESRLELAGGRYAAYYHVHSNDGHEGDTLKYVDAQTGAESTGWDWGCSHSMSNLLRFNPTANALLSACVTDCFPGTSGDFATNSKGGVYLNRRQKVMDVAGGCNGRVAGELGGAAAAPGGWKLVWNAHQRPAPLGQSSYNPASMNQDIAFSSIAANFTPGPIVWLTSTTGVNEADASIARWQPEGGGPEQYVLGWAEPGASYKYLLARVDPAGAFLEGPTDVTAIVRWGRRDDPFREHVNGDVVWAWFDAAGSTTLRVARLRAGGTSQCAAL